MNKEEKQSDSLLQLLLSLQEYIKQVSDHQIKGDMMLLQLSNNLVDKILILEEKVKALESGRTYPRSVN